MHQVVAMSFDSDHFGCILTTSLLHSRLTCRCENQTDGERNPKGELLSVEVNRGRWGQLHSHSHSAGDTVDRSVSGECSCFFKMIWGWSRQLDSYISGLPVYVTLCMSQIQGGQVKLLSQREIRTLQNCLRYSKKIIMKKPSAPRSDVRGLIPLMKFVSLLYFMSETTCDFFSTEPPVIISMEYFRNTSRI